VGAAERLGFMLFAIFAGFTGHCSARQTWLGMAKFLAAAIVIWAVNPLIKLFTKK
jgi:hypothetical protein